MANKLKRIAIGLMALSMRLDAYAIQRGMTMDAAHPKDPDPKNWRTINGSKVHLTEGKIDGGAGGKFTGKEWTGKTKHEFTPKEKAAESSSMPNFKKLPEESQKKLEHVTTHALNAWGSNGDKNSKEASAQKANKLLKEFCIENEITPSQKFEINELIKEFKADMISPSQFKEGVAEYAKCNIGHPAKAAAKPKAAPKTAPPKKSAPVYVPKQMDKDAYTYLLSSKKKQNVDDLAWFATYKDKKTDFDDPQLDFIKGNIKKQNKLDDKAMQGVKHAYEELQNGNISTMEFKNTVASIACHGVEEFVPPKPVKPVKFTLGQLQTKGLAKTKLTKATTGISTPKGTLGLYAAENESVIDPVFKNFEEQYGSAQTSKYTAAEHKFVTRYTQGSKHLRDYLCYGKVEGWGEYTKEALQEKVDNISTGLAKMDHPDMWVCRKCTLMDWATKNNPNGVTFEDLKKMKKNGEVFTNAAFLSSTPAEGGTYGDNELVRHFFVPKKAKGGYIKSVSNYENENEFLLDKGTKTRIMKVEKRDGKIITYEEVVLDDE